MSGARSFSGPGQMLPYEAMFTTAVLIATWLMAKIERRPTSVYGLGGNRRLRNFLSGLAWGVAMLSILVFTLRAAGLLVFDARQLFGVSALRYGALNPVRAGLVSERRRSLGAPRSTVVRPSPLRRNATTLRLSPGLRVYLAKPRAENETRSHKRGPAQ